MTDEVKLTPAPPFTVEPQAPMIFFDGAPTMATFNGIIALSLSAAFYEAGSDGQVKVSQAVVAHLRTNIVGAKVLREAIDKALLLAQPTETAAKN